MLSISTILLREPSWTNSPLWSSRPTGVPHGGRLSPIRTSCEQLRTLALRCPLVSGYLFIYLLRLYFLSFLCALSFTIFLLTLPKVHWTWQALGQELREPDRAAQAVEGVHDASGNFCLQLEGELGQSPANKSFQSLQLDLPVPKCGHQRFLWQQVPIHNSTNRRPLTKNQFDQTGPSCSTVSSLTSARPWMWWTKCGE